MVASSPELTPRRFTVGLTGGIGSGKSAVAELLAEMGAAVVDADRISHELTAPGGAAIEPLRAAFGDAMITAQGALDRARMRAAVFADPALRHQLESILHPRVGEVLRERAAKAKGNYLVLVVPLLVEGLARWRAYLDRIAVVDCPEALQIARVMQRSGLSAEEVRAIMATQATREARRGVADDLIDNGTSLDALRSRTRALHAQYLQMAGTI